MPAIVSQTSRPGLSWYPENDVVYCKVFGAAVTQGDLLNFDMAATQGGDLTVFDSLHPFNFVRPHNAAIGDQDLHIYGIALASGAVGARVPVMLHGMGQVRGNTSVNAGDLCVPLVAATSPWIEDLAITAGSPSLVCARAMETCSNDGDPVWVMFNGVWGIGATGTAYP